MCRTWYILCMPNTRPAARIKANTTVIHAGVRHVVTVTPSVVGGQVYLDLRSLADSDEITVVVPLGTAVELAS